MKTNTQVSIHALRKEDDRVYFYLGGLQTEQGS